MHYKVALQAFSCLLLTQSSSHHLQLLRCLSVFIDTIQQESSRPFHALTTLFICIKRLHFKPSDTQSSTHHLQLLRCPQQINPSIFCCSFCQRAKIDFHTLSHCKLFICIFLWSPWYIVIMPLLLKKTFGMTSADLVDIDTKEYYSISFVQGEIVSGHFLISCTNTSLSVNKIASALRCVRSADQNIVAHNCPLHLHRMHRTRPLSIE